MTPKAGPVNTESAPARADAHHDAEADGYSRHGWLPRGSDGLRYRLGVASRALAAIGGGYVLSALVAAVAAIYLPTTRAEAALAGQLVSFAVYTGAVMWVFAVRTAWRAWWSLLLAGLPFAAALLWHLYGRSAS